MEIKLDLRGVLRRTEPQDIPSRSLSYSGCWTCRERRTKCDERPAACRRCEDAKLVCAGYDIRLNWAEGVNQKRSRPGGTRRCIKPGTSLCQTMTDKEVTRALASIDKTTECQSRTAGPFSVFQVQPEHRQVDQLSGSSLLGKEEKPPTQRDIDFSQSDDLQPAAEQHPTFESDDPRWMSLSLTKDLNILSGEDSSVALNERNVHEIEDESENPTESVRPPGFIHPRDHFAQDIESSIPLRPPRAHELQALQIKGSMDVRMSLNTLTYSFGSPQIKNSSVTMLIHHYTNNIVHLMQPVSHKGNPFQTLYLPLAIEGSSDIEIGQGSRRGVSPATVAVFHSLLCSAATNLEGLGSRNTRLQQLAYRHKERALNALRNSLVRKIGRYKDLMVAILSLVSVDILDGGVNDHWIHLDAAIKLQASRQHTSLVGREASQLDMICTMLRLFAQTALPSPDPIPWNDNAGPDRTDYDFSDPSIEYMYGITTNLARLIKRIYEITRYLAFYKDREDPATLLAACEGLEDDLISWKIDSEPFSAIGTEREDAKQVARAQSRAFHSAALIYYYRSVQNCERRYLSVEQENILLAMNEAEDLKLCLIKDSSVPAPLTWPAFIASCEAIGEYRQRWNEWWVRVEKYRLKSFSKQHSIVQQVWKKLDRSESLTDWRDALVEMNFRIIPV